MIGGAMLPPLELPRQIDIEGGFEVEVARFFCGLAV